MMKENMEDMEVPEIRPEKHRETFKLVLLNARKSAYLGWLSILVPAIFIVANLLLYTFKLKFPLLSRFVEWFAFLDRSGFWFLIPLMFLLVPVGGLVLNLLSILHIRYQREFRELVVTVKLKWVNVLLISIILLIYCIFFLYLLTENA